MIVERARRAMGLSHEAAVAAYELHRQSGTGKTTVALRMANLLHRLGYIRKAIWSR